MSDLQAFTIYRANASMLVALDPTVPLLGTASLRINRNGTTGQFANLVRLTSPRAFTSGRARWLIGARTLQTNDRIGFVCQQSQEDLTGGAGAAYALNLLMASSGAGTWTPSLARMTAGLGTFTTLATGTNFTMAAAGKKALELTWILDQANLGGIQLQVKLGNNTDYSDLALDSALNIIVTSSVLTTSAGEGPHYNGLTTSGGDYLYDHFDVIPLIVGG